MRSPCSTFARRRHESRADQPSDPSCASSIASGVAVCSESAHHAAALRSAHDPLPQLGASSCRLASRSAVASRRDMAPPGNAVVSRGECKHWESWVLGHRWRMADRSSRSGRSYTGRPGGGLGGPHPEGACGMNPSYPGLVRHSSVRGEPSRTPALPCRARSARTSLFSTVASAPPAPPALAPRRHALRWRQRSCL